MTTGDHYVDKMKMLIIAGAFWLLAPGFTWAAQEAICASPAVLLCDNFDDRVLGNPGSPWPQGPNAKTPGWSLDGAGTNFVVTDEVFTGPNSLKINYPVCNFTNNSVNCGGGQMDPVFLTFSTTNMYVRQYVRWDSTFTWGDIGTKGFHHQAVGAPGSTRVPWWNIHGLSQAGRMYADNEGFGGQVYEQNQGVNLAFNRNQWYCLETHTQRNGSGAVSTFEMWIDDVLRLRYTDVDLTGATWNNILETGYFNTWGPAPPGVITQADCIKSGQSTVTWTGSNCRTAATAKWIDNIVVSTSRIGCIQPGTGPPGTPSGLTVTRAM